MGGMISTLRYVFQIVRASLSRHKALRERVASTPGIPVPPDPARPPPYWTVPPAPIARHGETDTLPQDEVDVVIIGSGITGTAVAKALLELAGGASGSARAIRVVMVEARDACSGSTGRNGGHVGPIIYNEYAELRDAFGHAAAEEILRFRLAHVEHLLSTARTEGLLSASQARMVDSYDVYGHAGKFAHAKEELREFLDKLPGDVTEGFGLIEDPQDLRALQLSTSYALGCVTRPGGAMHPYRFVTGLLSNLLDKYSNFQLFTRTPCTGISSTSAGYLVHTERGDIQTAHVVHATNAWSSHLLPGMRGKIVPTRTTMTAQRPGTGLATAWAGARAFVFYPVEDTSVFQYLTQLLPAPIPSDEPGAAVLPTAGEMMFGGRVYPAFASNIGVADDSGTIFENEAHLGGALERAFADDWGVDGGDEVDTAGEDATRNLWGKGRVKATWSGLLGMSVDRQPWVGRVPRAASRRTEPPPRRGEMNGALPLAPPGEWICAGYSGEGMVHAWLSGRSLACMVLGVSERERGERDLPKPFLISERRLGSANLWDTVAAW